MKFEYKQIVGSIGWAYKVAKLEGSVEHYGKVAKLYMDVLKFEEPYQSVTVECCTLIGWSKVKTTKKKKNKW